MKKIFSASILVFVVSLSTSILIGQNTPPSCVITAPHNAAYFEQGTDITIRVYSSDLGGTQTGGSIAKVEFFQDSIKLGEADTSISNTYSFVWLDVPRGTYRITAKATDNDTAVFTSTGVIITVDSLAVKTIGLSAGKGKYLGNITKSSVRADFNTYWNGVTSENGCKWGSIEGTRDVMNWTRADVAYNHAMDNHMVFRYHVLAWGSQYPSWIKTLSPAEFQAEMEEYMAAVAERYPLIDQIEVLNENMYLNTWNKEEHAEGSPYFREGLGGPGETAYDWAIWLFKKARHYFPNAKLVINDFELETNTAGRNEILDLVTVLRDSGLIDGFGTQAHYFNVDGMNANSLKNALNAMANSGLPLYVTELDLKGKSTSEASQLASYKSSFPVYWNHPAVAGITLWGYVEGSTWSTSTGLLNKDGSEREAMTWLKSFLAEQPLLGYPFKGISDTTDLTDNMIINGEFDYDTYAWQIEAYNGGEGSMTDVSTANMSGENALQICPLVPGTEPWHIQVSQRAPIEADKYYEISFLAKADASRGLAVTMQKNDSPYTRYMEETVMLSSANQSFSFLFRSPASDATNSLKFFAGLDTSCVYLDSVMMKEVDNTGTLRAEHVRMVSVYPNPVSSGTITVESKAGQTIHVIEVFDLQGKLVDTIHPEAARAEIEVSLLRKGICLLRIHTSHSLVSRRVLIL